MKMRFLALIVVTAVAQGGTRLLAEMQMGTAFTYQGHLKDGGSPANGLYDLEFTLYDGEDGMATLIAGPLVVEDAQVTNGLFTVQVDFGDQFNGMDRWLEIGVRPGAEMGGYTPLAGRQQLSATPYAHHATKAALAETATTVPWSAITDVPDFGDGDSSYWDIGEFVSAWGNNSHGQGAPPPHQDFFSVQAGYGYSVALGPLGIYNWGNLADGLLFRPGGPHLDIAAGFRHTIAIRMDSTLVGWGHNLFGATDVPAGTFTDVAAGYYFNVGIRTDGTLAAWGANTCGQLDVPAGTFTAVSAGDCHAVGIRTDGTLAAWGANNVGQIDVPSGTFIAISAGVEHNLALRTDGTLAAWGSNDNGELNVPEGTFKAVAVGGRCSIAVRSDGALVGWGLDFYGVLDLPAGTYVAVSTSGNHAVAMQEQFATNTMTRVTTDLICDGRVGIGTGAFPASLTVAGGIRARGGPPGSNGVDNNGYAFMDSGDSDSGMFSTADGRLEFYTNNAERVRITPNGHVGIGTGNPQEALSVAGTIESTTGGFKFPDGTAQASAAIDSQWNESGSDIYYSAGKVGIGTDNPQEALSVAGTIESTTGGFKFPDGTTQTTALIQNQWSESANDIYYITGNVGIGTSAPASRLSVSGDIDISGSRLHVGTDGNVGIGTAAPQELLSVAGTIESTTGGFKFPDGSVQSNAAIDSQWSASGSDIFFNSGNVGIGTEAPQSALSVGGSVDTQGGIGIGTTAILRPLTIQGTDADSQWVQFRTSSAQHKWHMNGLNGGLNFAETFVSDGRLFLAAGGNVGIGTTAPAQRLHVVGNICATGTIGACSDARFKEHVEPVAGALEKVSNLRGVNFDWKREAFPDHQFAADRQLGFIAQEVEKVLPQVVSRGEDGYLSVDYSRLTPVLVEAVKELRQETEWLRGQRDAQFAYREARMAKLEQEISELKDEVRRLSTKKGE